MVTLGDRTDKQLRLELNETTLHDSPAYRNHDIIEVDSVNRVVLHLHGDSTRGVDLTSKLHMYPSKLATTCPHTIEISRTLLSFNLCLLMLDRKNKEINSKSMVSALGSKILAKRQVAPV